MSQSAPLSISLNLSNVKNEVPTIADGHNCRCKFVGVKQIAKEKGPMLTFEFQLQDPAPTTDAGQVRVGFPLFENITLYDKNMVGEWSAEKTPDWASTKITKIIDAFLGTGDKGNRKGKPERPDLLDAVPAMVSKEAYLKVKVRSDGDGNNIDKYIPSGDMQA